MPSRAEGLADLRYLHVVHQTQAENGLAFQLRAWTTDRQHEDFPRPEGRKHPFDNVARGMTLAVNLAFLIHLVAAGGNNFCLERQISRGQADAVELNLEISLAPEMAGILGRIQMADQIAAPGEGLL